MLLLKHMGGCVIYRELSVGEKRRARHADLHDFLMRNHPLDVVREGKGLRLKDFPGVFLKEGFCGYKNFVDGTTGNSVDLLTTYLGYSFSDAVAALLGDYSAPRPPREIPEEKTDREIVLPVHSVPPYKRVFAYLTRTRGIPSDTVQKLMNAGLLYQENIHGNAVFVNRNKDYCEIRGTLSYGAKPFHGCLKSRSDNYWSFGLPSGERPTAYICEAAIDAVSLYELLRLQGPVNAIFCSIGGVANQKTIARIAEKFSAVLAVDNDDAGIACLARNSSIPFIQPTRKDWNQDWLEFLQNKKAADFETPHRYFEVSP